VALLITRNLPERRAIIAGSSARAKRGKGSTIAAKVARQPSSPTSLAGSRRQRGLYQPSM
jgi:hypothetical protein